MMAAESSEPNERDARWSEVLVACFDTVEGSALPNRDALLARHPEFTAELTAFLAHRDRLERLAAPLRAAVLVPLTAGQATNPTASPAGGPAPAPPLRCLGEYQLLEEIGRGGMGVVYKARQKSPDRLVALKLICPGRLLDSADVRRFRNEAEAAALLDHPNIVPIHEVGEEDGTLYFTMRWIDGGSLAAISKMATPAPRHTAGVVATIARAVHHAHQRGVLHRDLKPSNILLDASGRPYVADFGLAKRLHADDDLTQSGAVLGTPAYVAPEQASPTPFPSQAAGGGRATRATTAADVYGLGGVLYALLTGRPPFQGLTPLETLTQVRECDPQPPRRFNPTLDADLEAVCLKCLEKEPNRRYGSAEELAEDLERWLASEPTRARPLGRVDRALRWCRRNPATTTAVGSILVMMLVGIAGSVWGVWRYTADLRSATGVAEGHRQAAERQRKLALDNLRAVIIEIKDLENRRPELDDLRQDLLLRVQKYLIPILQDPGHEVRADETNFWLEIDIGDVFRDQDHQIQSARIHYDRALAIADQIGSATEQTRLCRRLRSFALSRMGDTFSREGNLARSLEEYRAMFALREKLYAELADRQARADLAVANLKIGVESVAMYAISGQEHWYDAAIRHSTRSCELYQALEREFPDDIEYPRMLGHVWDTVADAARARRDWAAAIEACREALAIRRSARSRFPECELAFELDDTFSLEKMLSAYELTAQFQTARPLAEEALRILADLVSRNPRSVSFRKQLSLLHDRLGGIRRGLGQYDLARASFERSLAIQKDIVGQVPNVRHLQELYVWKLDRLVELGYMLDENDAQTLRYAEELLHWQRRILADNPNDHQHARRLFECLSDLGDYHLLHSRAADARRLYGECHKLGQEVADMGLASKERDRLQRRISLSSRASEPGFDPAAGLLDLTHSCALQFRLQRVFDSRKDATRLAQISDQLARPGERFDWIYASACGFARAAALAAPEGERRRYEQRCDELLARLLKFGGEVPERVRQNPAFSGRIPLEQAKIGLSRER